VSRRRRVQVSTGCFALLLALALGLAWRGTYGWTLFVTVPMIAGAISTWTFRPTTAGNAAATGALVGACGCASFLVLGADGAICVLMAIPVVVPLAVLGSLLAFWGNNSPQGKRPAGMALLLPLSMLFDTSAKPPVYQVKTSIVVNAAPARVWKNVVAFSDISDTPDWVLRTGLAYPIRTRIEGSGVGSSRSCDLSTGTVEERVVVWDEPRLLRFAVTATPPAMREIGLYGAIEPKHLNGYYSSKEGQFELTSLPGDRTLVVGTTWYQHGLWPAAYWRFWSDAVIHHIHGRVLRHIRALSEGGKSGSSSD
jgi:Polyketide cyclase / dehydrase and lipid transport